MAENNDDYIQSLQQQHAEADCVLREEMKRPCPDDLVMKELKRKKLMLKQKLEGMGATTLAKPRRVATGTHHVMEQQQQIGGRLFA